MKMHSVLLNYKGYAVEIECSDFLHAIKLALTELATVINESGMETVTPRTSSNDLNQLGLEVWDDLFSCGLFIPWNRLYDPRSSVVYRKR